MKSSTIEKNNTSTKMNGPISPVRDGETDADRTEEQTAGLNHAACPHQEEEKID